jgi:hypothetical protein
MKRLQEQGSYRKRCVTRGEEERCGIESEVFPGHLRQNKCEKKIL